MHFQFLKAVIDIAKSTRINAIGRVADFGKSSSGNIAVLFAVCLVPLLVAVGCAVDDSVANNQRTKMQSALDSAVLAGSIAGKAILDAGGGNTAAIAAAQADSTGRRNTGFILFEGIGRVVQPASSTQAFCAASYSAHGRRHLAPWLCAG